MDHSWHRMYHHNDLAKDREESRHQLGLDCVVSANTENHWQTRGYNCSFGIIDNHHTCTWSGIPEFSQEKLATWSVETT